VIDRVQSLMESGNGLVGALLGCSLGNHGEESDNVDDMSQLTTKVQGTSHGLQGGAAVASGGN
jgi:hypothetical protein